MLFHIKGQDVVTEYILECYRRLYFESVDKTGSRANFDMLYAAAMLAKRQNVPNEEIDYRKYYSPNSLQNKIINALVKEPYVTVNNKTGNFVCHKLRKHEAQVVMNSVYLGCSPFSSFSGFCRSNPEFKKYYHEYCSDLSEEDKNFEN